MSSAVQFDASRIRLILLDVDGVLTDGRVALLPGGDELKFFSIYDGHGIRRAQQAGWRVGFISGRKSAQVQERARELGVELLALGSRDKLRDYQRLLAETGVSDAQVAYMGDDLPDLPILERAGFSAAPANAVPEVRSRVDYVTQRRGGEGAVRELIDLLLPPPTPQN